MDTQPTPQLNPEQPIGGGPESSPQPIAPETGSGAAYDNAGKPNQPVVPPRLTAADVAAAMAAVPAPAAPVPSSVSASPSVAADQDVIEPEWVEKAEQIVTDTNGNPYAEEEGIEALQIDYLKQRYGHEVKKPEND